MWRRIGRVLSAPGLFMLVCAIFFAGKPQPLAAQESNRKPACGCYTCKTPLTVEFENKDKDCYGILAADACPTELSKLPAEERGRFCEKLKTAGAFTSFKDSCPVYTRVCDETGPPANSTGSGAETGDTVEVDIRCPPSAQTVSINWKNHLQGSQDFEIDSGSEQALVPFHDALREGQTIRCHYQMTAGPQGHIAARYSYKVKRDIVSCIPISLGYRCRVKR